LEAAIDRSEVWAQAVASLSRDPRSGLNTAYESCERWASDRSRLALVVHHADGRVERWTAFDLARRAARASGMLRAAGLRRDGRVAAILGRQVEASITALGCWRSGLTYVPLFGGFGGDAIAQRLAAADVRHVVVDAHFRKGVEEAQEKLPYELEVICVTGPHGIGLRQGDRSFWAELDRATPEAALETAAEDPATLMFTSGTTSVPKACVIPHSGFVALIPYVRHCLAIGRGDLLFTTADPGWSYGLYTTGCAPSALGIPRLIYTGDFDPAAWLRVIEEEQVTFIGAAPTAYRRLVTAARRHPVSASVRGASSSGEPLDAETSNGWRAASGSPLRDAYGLSELGMVLADLGEPETPLIPGGLAAAIPGFDVELVNESGEVIVEPGPVGTIAVARPPFPFAIDYLNAPDEWQRRWETGRFRTGDLGRRDENGTFFFVGRSDDVIVTSGYNVGPAEVESVLLEHPGVIDAAAVAGVDPVRGAVVRAVVVRAGTISDEKLTSELRLAVRERIGRHAEPKIVDFVADLPRTETGKLRRVALRDR
jgi:acetyl-CoA synthetase